VPSDRIAGKPLGFRDCAPGPRVPGRVAVVAPRDLDEIGRTLFYGDYQQRATTRAKRGARWRSVSAGSRV